MVFPKQDGLPSPSAGALPDLGIEPVSPALAGRFFTTEEPGSIRSISSVQFSRSVVSDSLRPHESQHARPPCPSPAPGVYSNSCSLSRWCHPAISSSVVPFSSCPQSLPASGSFPMSQLFIWGGQSIGASASASVLPMKHRWWNNAHSTSWSPGLRAQTQLKSPWNPIIFLHPPKFLSFYDTNIALKFLVFWASLFSNIIFYLFQVSDGFI